MGVVVWSEELGEGPMRGKVERSWQCVIVRPEVVDEILVAEEEEEEVVVVVVVNDDAEFELVIIVEVGSWIGKESKPINSSSSRGLGI